MTGPAKPKPLLYVIVDAPVELLGLSTIEKSVLVHIVSHYNSKRNGAEVWPSKARIEALTGASEPAVRRAIKKLEWFEYIKVQSHTGSTNVYTINVDVIRATADPRLCDGGKAEVIHNPRHTDGGTPVTETGDPRHGDALTANRTAKGNSGYAFGCSARLKVSEHYAQRKLAVHGVVAETVGKMSLSKREQPKREKAEEGADIQDTFDGLAAKERPG